ncbi:MAG: hypothetical protein QNJ46_10745 [Leptolyngbyaceae cyanobacterium MO_188.B28]|nr:hypothetical protein [Leptolyngbyaceae cyanobacterium MO_188.B28]
MYPVDKDYPVDKKLAELGERLDGDCEAGNYSEALQGYQAILDSMLQKQDIDSFLLAKLTLGKLLTLVRSGKITEAHQVWSAEPSSFDGLGVQFLEAGQVSVLDSIIYLMISGFFYSISAGNLEVAIQGVNDRMNAVCKYGLADNPAILPQAFSNWHRFLQNVFSEAPYNGVPPEDALSSFRTAIAAYRKTIQLVQIDFPSPSPWLVDW